MNRTEEIVEILKSFIEPRCELDFKNNYELICAVMLSAQTTDRRVNQITPNLFSKYKNFYELRDASLPLVKSIINPLGLAQAKSKNLISLAKEICDRFDGEVPNSMEKLLTLPGIGRKTANVVLGLGFNVPAIAVDTHVARVSNRLKISKGDNPLKIEEDLMAKLPKYKWIDAHHLLLLFGRYYCKAVNPSCEECMLKQYCIKK